MYQQEEEDDPRFEIGAEEEEGVGYNFDMEMDQEDDGDDAAVQIDPEELRRKQNEILFATQGVGRVKNINGYDVYVKNKQCEASLRDIHKFLKHESMAQPTAKLTLGEWEFLQNDLIPLLIFHKKDKKLSFLTCMLLVQLTEIPQQAEPGQSQALMESSWINPKSQYRHRMFESLRGYKEAFLQPQVVSVLMEHLADCLQAEDKNQKHEQMIELIIVLFK